MKTLQKKLLIFLLTLPLGVFAQNAFKGKVVDNNQQPLPSVNIMVEGTKNGTVTDFDGNFSLTNVKKGENVFFSYLGFKNQTLAFNGQNNVTIVMVEDATQLQDVVLIGYGTTKKEDLTGSVAVVSSKDFNKGAVATAENLLNGKVAGLTINTSGAPGSGSEIRIRGGASLSASNDPLIVIDGLPIANDGGVGSTSALASINPNDIESFTVLKDASATAIYGSRASNGVIIIKTKSGGKDLAVDYNFQYGSGKNYNTIDVLNADQFRDVIATQFPNEVDQLGTANTNWQDEIYRRTDFVDSNLSLKGSLFGVLPTRLSIGNTYQEGLRLTNAFTRNNVSLNLNPSLFKDHLKIRLAATYSNQRNRFADGVEGSAIRFDPTQPVYEEGSFNDDFFEYVTGFDGNGNAVYANPSIGNPVAQLLQTNDRGVNNRLFGNLEFDYKFHFLPELRAVVNLGYDYNDGLRTRYRSNTARSGFNNNNVSFGTNFRETREIKNTSLDSYLVYNKTFNKLNFEATAGYSYQKFEGFGTSGVDTSNPNSFAVDYIDTDVLNIGMFARTNFSYDDKYLLTLTYRRDGTSRFNDENRWGNFPAVALAWKLKNEFFKNNKNLSDLKLRLGYGITGQQNIGAGNYFRPLINIGNPNSQYLINGQLVNVGVPSAFNSQLKWELTTTYNAGIDFGFANNRLTGAVDVFYKQSDDLLQSGAPFADGSNFSNTGLQNVGSMNTKGFEVSIDYKVISTQDVNWSVNVNAGKYERRIDQLAAGQAFYTGNIGAGTGGTSQIVTEGFTPYSFFVYKQLYNTDGSPIEGAFADLNGDGIISGLDRYIYKNGDPDLTLGFSTTFDYKNFDFGFNLRANIGNRVMNLIPATSSYYSQLVNGTLQNVSTNVLNTNYNVQTQENILSDMYVENASFLRMDYVTAGYTFPKWLEGKASLRLFAGMQNPFIITKYSGLDPEITGGTDNTIYPRQRQVLMGANIKF